MNSIIIFSLGFLLGLVFCLAALYLYTKTNPFRLNRATTNTKNENIEFKSTLGEKAPDEFIQSVVKVIEEKMEEEDFCVEELARVLLLSRSQLFRKIKDKTGMSPSQFLRKSKLDKAHQLLAATELNVTQVAYKAGFKDLGHFSKCFSKEFGLNPKRIKQKAQFSLG